MSTEKASILPLFTWFHQHPEVGHTEFATTQKIKETLEDYFMSFYKEDLDYGGIK